jgi:hypothetical protein
MELEEKYRLRTIFKKCPGVGIVPNVRNRKILILTKNISVSLSLFSFDRDFVKTIIVRCVRCSRCRDTPGQRFLTHAKKNHPSFCRIPPVFGTCSVLIGVNSLMLHSAWDSQVSLCKQGSTYFRAGPKFAD